MSLPDFLTWLWNQVPLLSILLMLVAFSAILIWLITEDINDHNTNPNNDEWN